MDEAEERTNEICDQINKLIVRASNGQFRADLMAIYLCGTAASLAIGCLGKTEQARDQFSEACKTGWGMAAESRND